ncbi:Oxidoreductase, molybdopterin-binding domain protein [Metarhizium album ARSEF 1941]|uniref:Nitrate reductase [NADPH] n=1 Tax=Metarhizium album (strain ARSEF 1941) TaxID=1081103 RepID=A0A0B2WPR7_METAS|nr:Oxidoreductase, molybdopterin-binding domain protein [Metarhizium album ARSEF 1941]KHN95477.1 Oxidoreductase, molybdopterin-binding domain protein [Metarhizium album ARSEF 1941]
MNSWHSSCISRQLLRLRVSQPRPASDFFPTTPCRRPFSYSSPRRAEVGRRHHGPASRVSVQRHLVQTRSRVAALTASLGLLSLALYVFPTPPTTLDAHYASSPSSFKPQPAPSPDNSPDNRDPDLPRFRIAEVRKHGADSEHPWVIHGNKVYDITDWVPAHPGGQVILRAAGGPIDPYWDIFTIHKNQYVYEILSQYLIGYVDQADLVNGKPAQEQIEDPFENDPERHPSLITRTDKPRNAETPGELLTAQFLTPNELFYVRNHMWVPTIQDSKSDDHRLTVELLDGTMREYTLRELKTRFPSRKVTAALQCSGNRRKHMSDDSGRQTNGLPWTSGAISNASWEGVLLSHVLADAGFDVSEAMSGSSETQHVQFTGLEAYGASIPIKKAIDPQGDVLLAYSMNDKPLPPDHGFPLRAIVPGHVAARSVKWLNHITLSDEESTSQWQRKDYKCFGPNQTKVDWDAAPAIQELPVQSAITTLKLGEWLNSKTEPNVLKNDQDQTVSSQSPPPPQQEISMSGYAFSGGGRSIIRVDVSLDGGNSWTQACLLPDCVSKNGMPSPCQGHGAWYWKRWVFKGGVPLDAFKHKHKHGGRPDDPVAAAANAKIPDSGQKRCTTVLVKATDDAYNTQPESHAATWNFRGNLATAWHRVQVCTDCSRAATSNNNTRKKSSD